jgi:hypothetical protein
MKQKSVVEEKPFTSSLNICPEACCIKGQIVTNLRPDPDPDSPERLDPVPVSMNIVATSKNY